MNLADSFVEICNKNRNSIAIEALDAKISYKSLLEDVDRYTFLLSSFRLVEGDRIGVYLTRSPDFVALVMAALRLNLVYVPLDKTIPQKRIQYIIKASKIKCLFTDENFSFLEDEGLDNSLPQVYNVSIIPKSFENKLLENHKINTNSINDNNDVYIIFTSGSTGNPKGVRMHNKALQNLIKWQIKEFGNRNHGIKTAQFAPINFDVSFQEIFSTLLSAGTLVIIPDDVKVNPQEMLAFLNQNQINRLFLPYVALKNIADFYPNFEKKLFLYEIITSGEQLIITDSIRSFFVKNNNIKLINQYGPTETHVVSFYNLPNDPRTWKSLPPIGKAIDNVDLYVMDNKLNEVPDGVVGELCIGGICLSSGYLEENKTNERFIIHDFIKDKIYRTGDLVRKNEDGLYYYLGREDTQVKVRGYRVELGEVECILNSHPVVKDCVVSVLKDQSGIDRLVVSILLDELLSMEYNINQDNQIQCRSQIFKILYPFLKENLPDYMIPVHYSIVSSIPRTQTGKIDRRSFKFDFYLRPRLANTYHKPRNNMEEVLQKLWQEVLQIEDVGVEDNFFDLGGHSLLLVVLYNNIKNALKMEFSIVNLLTYPNIRSFVSNLMISDVKSQENMNKVQDKIIINHAQEHCGNRTNDIAIIGISCKFPGADNIEEFWKNLVNAKESISQFNGAFEDLSESEKIIYSGGIVNNIELFDYDFWGYSKREAELMDPQHRLFLTCAWEAMEDAGYDYSMSQTTVGVYGGCGPSTYLYNNLLPNQNRAKEISFVKSVDELSILMGNYSEYLTTKLSYKLNLCGPSINVQSACSTGLVAVHFACMGIINQECEVAIAGASTIVIPQNSGYVYQEEMMYSKDGHCRPFDAESSGTVFSNGVGVVILKSLKQAQADGDRIYAVIKASSINNDGNRKVGYTATSSVAQELLIQKSLSISNIDSTEIDYIEAHGTGTTLGDPVEVAALSKVFGGSDKKYCGIGSVKSNIGHLAWSSGIAGLIKTTLGLYNAKLLPTINFKNLNPNIDITNTPLYVVDKLFSYDKLCSSFTSGVTSLGLGGTNAFVLLKKYVQSDVIQNVKCINTSHIVTFSAKSETSLKKLLKVTASYLDSKKDILVRDIAYTRNKRRKHFDEYRISFIVNSIDELINQVQESSKSSYSLQSNIAEKLIIPTTLEKKYLKIAFLFSGHGTQYAGMALNAYKNIPRFKLYYDECEHLVMSYINFSIVECIGQEQNTIAKTMVEEQVLLFSIGYSLYKCLEYLGITPEYIAGHSLGEIVGACVAGVFPLNDAIRIVVTRASLLEKLPTDSEMISVATDSDAVMHIAEDMGISIAAVNSQYMTVFSGRKERIITFKSYLKSNNITYEELNVSRAGHSSEIDSILNEYKEVLSKIEFNTPKFKIFSNVTGELACVEFTDSDYWCNQIRNTVQFKKIIDNLYKSDVDCFIEIGPSSTLLSLIFGHNPDTQKLYLPLMRKNYSDELQFLKSLSVLYYYGTNIDWNNWYQDYPGEILSLPNYQFDEKKCWINARNSKCTSYSSIDKEEVSSYDLSSHYEVMLQDSVLSNNEISNSDNVFLLFIDKNIYEKELSFLLKQGKYKYYIIKPGFKFQKQNSYTFEINPSSVEDIDQLFYSVSDSKALHVIYNWGYNICPVEDLSVNLSSASVYISSVYTNILKSFSNINIDRKYLKLITYNALGYNHNASSKNLLTSLYWGITKTFGIEYPDISTQRIDIDDTKANASVVIFNEITSNIEEDWVIYEGETRKIGVLSFIQQDKMNIIQHLKDGYHVLLGGGGEIGNLLVKWLIKNNADKIIIVSRSPLSSPKQKFLERLSKNLSFEVADIADQRSVSQLFDNLIQQKINIISIFHIAGVIEDSTIQNMTYEKYYKVYAPKVFSTLILEDVINKLPSLKLLLFFSSATALIGNPGQSNHAAANFFLDSYARYKSKGKVKTLSINWGTWGEVGKLTTNKMLMTNIKKIGYRLLSNSEGIEALQNALQSVSSNQAYIPIDWDKFINTTSQNSKFYKNFIKQEVKSVTSESIFNKLSAVDNDNLKYSLLREYLVQLISNFIGDDDETLISITSDTSKKIKEFGIDSLSSIQIKNKIQNDLYVKLPLSYLVDYPTIELLVKQLSNLIKCFSIPQVDTFAISNITSSIRDLSIQQKRWINLIKIGYGQRVVPIVFDYKLDRKAIKSVLKKILERHELLRYKHLNEKVELLSVDNVLPLDTDLFIDVSDLPLKKLVTRLGYIAQEMKDNMPDIERGVCWSIKCINLSSNKFTLFIALQHLEFDGTSLTTFENELSMLYEAEIEGKSYKLEQIAQYYEYVEWQRDYLQNKIFEDRGFFTGLFATAKGCTLLPGKKDLSVTTPYKSKRFTVSIDNMLIEQLNQYALSRDVSVFAVLFSIYAKLVGIIINAEDITISIINSGRADIKFKKTIGPFTAPFPVRIILRNNVSDLIQECNQLISHVNARSYYPVSDLITYNHCFNNLPIDSYFSDVGINFTNYRITKTDAKVRTLEILGPLSEKEFVGINTSELKRIPGLHLVINTSDNNMLFNFWYHEHRFKKSQVQSWGEKYIDILESVIKK